MIGPLDVQALDKSPAALHVAWHPLISFSHVFSIAVSFKTPCTDRLLSDRPV